MRLLHKCFVIYASGAGVKAKFNQEGDILPDEKYTRGFKEVQVEELNTFLTKLISIWEELVRCLRENVEKNGDKLVLNDIETVERKIKNRLAKEEIETLNKDILDKYQVNILEILNENLLKILQDINEILNSSSKSEEGKDAGKEEKRVKYKKKLEEQLNPNISEEELKNRKNWPFIDSRTNIPKDKLTQITLKPIYPAEKHIASKEDSAREILGNLIIEPVVKKINSLLLEIQPELVSVEVTLGGSTSIDFARTDINKSIAAEDLIKGARLEKERDLLLAIGDEFIFTGVDFAFLKTPEITVFSIEDTKDSKERKYKKADNDEINANWFWSGNYPELGGVGISATLGIYSMLEELYAEEVFRLFEGEKDIVPAIRRLRQRLEKGHLQLSTTDGGQIETKPLEQLSSYNRHKENFKIEFGTSGWRGVIEKDFDIHNVRRVAQAVAEYYLNYIKTGIILIGFDPRKGNRENAMEIAAIMAANGIPVRIIETEPTPTPVLAYLANSSEEIKGVINLTASHNPYEDAGFKFSPYHGGAAEKAITTKIEDSANSITEYKVINYEEGVKEGIIEEYEVEKAIDIYVNGYIIPTIKEIGAWETIISYIKENREFKLILDPMQGTSVKYMGAIYGAMRKEVGRDFYTMIHINNRDSEFKEVNGAPNPTESENIQELLQMMIEDSKVFKLATDGDADRFGVIDFGGKELSANEIMAMLVYFLHSKGFEGIVGKTVSTSNFVNAVAEYLDIELLEEPVGFKWFVARVINEGKQFIVAGEESAHVGIGPFMKSWDDGIAIGLMCLWMTADTGKSLTSYKEEIETTIDKKFHYKRGKVDLTASLKKKTEEFINNVKEEQKKEISLEEMGVIKVLNNLGLTQKAVSVITVDGLKVVFKSGDWFCIRLSGTQFVSRLYTEVTDINREDGLVILGNKLFEDIDGQDGGTFIQTIGNMSEQGAAIIVAVDATYKNEVNFDGGKVRLANRPILQVKIDVSNLTEAVKTAKEAVRGGADWIEMSAGLNLSETIKTIQRLKNEFPETKVSVDFDVVTVDMPMVDVVTEVIEAGADIISVYEDLIRQDRIITMIDKVKEFKENGRDIKLRVN
ncbi:MAG: hypothetical protein KAJ79_03585, partial [Candidatus Omnitrophica bacterium]|nr:hypothetical protein [Candidatus Omnitrophota bacterium]